MFLIYALILAAFSNVFISPRNENPKVTRMNLERELRNLRLCANVTATWLQSLTTKCGGIVGLARDVLNSHEIGFTPGKPGTSA